MQPNAEMVVKECGVNQSGDVSFEIYDVLRNSALGDSRDSDQILEESPVPFLSRLHWFF